MYYKDTVVKEMVYTEKEKLWSSDKEEGEGVGKHDHGSKKEEATEDTVTVDGGGSDTSQIYFR